MKQNPSGVLTLRRAEQATARFANEFLTKHRLGFHARWLPGVSGAEVVEGEMPMGQVQRIDAFTPRAVDRSDVCIETEITVAHRPRAITIVNLSSHGFMGECPAGVPLNSRISLDVPGIGSLAGCVRWAVGRRVGGRFDTPLDDDQLADAFAAVVA